MATLKDSLVMVIRITSTCMGDVFRKQLAKTVKIVCTIFLFYTFLIVNKNV